MSTEEKTVEPFEFLNPLDGKTYTLPPFNKDLSVDRVTEFVDTLPPLPSIYETLASDDPDAFSIAVDARQSRLTWLQTMSVVKTIDAHIPDPDDPAKAAIIANINAMDFGFLYKMFTDWLAAAGEKAEDPEGED